MKIKHIFISILSLLSINSFALDVNTSFKSTATILKKCNIKVTDLSFGDYKPQSDSFASSSMDVLCTKDTSYKIGIDYYQGNYTLNRFKTTTDKFSVFSGGARYNAIMFHSNNVDNLAFNIFQDSAYSQIFGDSSTPGNNWQALGSQVSVQKISSGSLESIPFYGAMSSGQYPKPGLYRVSYFANVYF